LTYEGLNLDNYLQFFSERRRIEIAVFIYCG
jgi:hypothetical protein